MTNYLLKTEHNQALSEALEAGAVASGLTYETVEEAFASGCWQRVAGAQKIPSLVAIAEIEGENKILHQTDSIYQIAGFQAAADAALAELQA